MAYEKSKVSNFGTGSLASPPPLVGFEYCHQVSRVPGEVPEPGSLGEGELAVNVADGIVYYRSPSGEVSQLAPGDAPSDGGTYAREDGAWVDVAQAANLQLRRGTEAERTQVTPLEGEPIYTTDSKKLYIGDGQTVGGNEIVSGEKAPQLNPRGMARMVTVRSDGTFNITVKSTTGYVAARWWDGSVEVFGAGVAANDITVSKAAPTTGNWMKSAPKEIFIWSCTGGNANQNGELTFLSSEYQYLTSLDVAGLAELQALYCTNDWLGSGSNCLSSLNLSGLTSLTTLDCSENALTSLDFSGLTSLASLNCRFNALTSLDFSGLTSLASLDCRSNALTSLDVSGLLSLTSLKCDSNALTSLDVSGLTSLTSLTCSSNALTSLDVSGLTSLTSLTCSSNALTSLDVSGLTSLTSLICGNNSFTSLNVSGLTSLITLSCGGNSLASLVMSGLTSLRSLTCSGSAITSLDLSGESALQSVSCTNNNALTSLNVSGLTSLTRLSCENNSLTSLRAQNVGFSGGYYYSSYSASNAANVSNNQLDSAALDQFYTDLSAGDSPLLVFNNPGTASDNPAIATAKGYTVYGS